MSDLSFSGVYAAVPTPMTADGAALDRAGIGRLTDHLVGAGAHGLVVAGSTGEFTSLDLGERRLVAEAFVAAVDGRVPVVVGTGAPTTADATELSAHAAKAGATAVMVAPPYYDRPSVDELADHLRAVVEAAGIPAIYYHMPALTGVELSADELSGLVRRSGLAGVKDSGGDSTVFTALQQDPDVGAVLNGWDGLTMAAFAGGATAGIWGMAAVLPAQCSALYDALVPRGDLAAARAQWADLFPICRFLDSVNYVAAIKAGLDLVGVDVGPPRLPLRALSADDRARLGELLSAAGAQVVGTGTPTGRGTDDGRPLHHGR